MNQLGARKYPPSWQLRLTPEIHSANGLTEGSIWMAVNSAVRLCTCTPNVRRRWSTCASDTRQVCWWRNIIDLKDGGMFQLRSC